MLSYTCRADSKLFYFWTLDQCWRQRKVARLTSSKALGNVSQNSLHESKATFSLREHTCYTCNSIMDSTMTSPLKFLFGNQRQLLVRWTMITYRILIVFLFASVFLFISGSIRLWVLVGRPSIVMFRTYKTWCTSNYPLILASQDLKVKLLRLPTNYFKILLKIPIQKSNLLH